MLNSPIELLVFIGNICSIGSIFMVDVHCHLNFKAFEKDYDQVIKRAFEAGVTKIINVGTKLDSSIRAVELADEYENLYAIVGVHPHHADKVTEGHPERSEGSPDDWIKQLERLAKHPKVVAIGETGLDNYRYQSNGIVDPVTQKEVFEQQIELASKFKLPLQIHNRHAGKDIIEILKHHKNSLQPIPGMFHCFSGGMEILKSALQMGFYIGFDGNITYPGLAPGEDTKLSDLASYTPIDRIMVETDSPYLPPVPYRGSRNEPIRVILTGEFIAKLKSISFEEFNTQTEHNAETLFKLSSNNS